MRASTRETAMSRVHDPDRPAQQSDVPERRRLSPPHARPDPGRLPSDTRPDASHP